MAIVVPVVSTWDGSGLDRAVRDISAAETQMERVKAIGAGLQSVGRSLTLGVTLPIAAAGAASVKAAAEFEVSMKSFETVSGATAEQMKLVEDQAKRLGQETVFSTRESAQAMLELAKAGVSVEEILAGGAAAAIDLAAAEGMDLAYAAEIMAQGMNAFNIEGKDASRVADALAQGAIDSTAGVEDLAYGLKYVSSSAAALGVPLEDTIAALGLLNNAGLTGTTAGTSLNQMFTALAGPTKQAAEEMDKLGFSAFDASGNLKPMDQMLGELGKSLEGLSEEERLGALKKIFNQRGMRAANILLKDGVDGWNEMADGIRNSAGAADELANARMGGLWGDLERVRGAVENLGLAFGSALAPVVSVVAGGLEKLATWFSNLNPTVQSVIAAILVLVAALGPVLMIVGFLITNITAIAGVLGTVATAIGVTTGALLGWIAVIALVIAAVVAAAVIIVKHWDEIKAFFIKVWDTIVGYVKDKLAEFKAAFPNVFGAITGILKIWWTTISTLFISNFNILKALVTAALTAIKEWFTFYFTAIWGIIKTAFSIIWTIVSGAFKTLMTLIDTALGVIKAIFQGDFDKIPGIVKGGFDKVYAIVKEVPSKILHALGDLGKLLWDAGKDLISGLIGGIKSMFGSLSNVIGNILGKLNPFKSAASAVGASRMISPYAVGLAGGVGQYGVRSGFSTSNQNVMIRVDGSQDPYTTARVIKRALEGYDVSQGRPRGQVLARAW